MKPQTQGIKTRGRLSLIATVLLSVSQLFGLASRSATSALPANTAEGMAATAAIQGDRLRLSNRAIAAEWQVHEGGLIANTLADHLTNRSISLAANAFVVSLRDGTVLKSSEMHVIAPPRM